MRVAYLIGIIILEVIIVGIICIYFWLYIFITILFLYADLKRTIIACIMTFGFVSKLDRDLRIWLNILN